MRGTKISKLVLGGILFLILGTLLITTISRGDLVGLAAEGVATPVPSPTPTLFLAWQNATLDQIHFGEPKVVLTDTLGLRIVGWISNAEALIQRDTVAGGNGSAIEVFNVKTQEVRRLAEGKIWGKPIWSSWERAIAYLLYDNDREMTSLVWQTLDGQPVKMLDGAVQPIVLSPDGRGAMAYSTARGDLRGKVCIPLERDIKVNFARFAPPARNLGCGWKYDTAVSPDGKWQVVYNCEHFLLVNSGDGTIKELDLGTEIIEGRPFPRWALDAQWSQDGRQLAVASTFGDFLPRITGLLILDPWEERVRKIECPPSLLFSEVDWAPEGRHLLVSGLEAIGEGTFLPGMWLVDVKMGRIRDLTLPVARSEDPRGGAAWSPDGKHLLFYCRPKSASKSALCLTSVEVEQ